MRQAAEGLARRTYESGGPDAVKRSQALREKAIKELERQQNKKP